MSVLTRAVAILARPGSTWEAIAAEPPEPRGLFRGYVAPLAAIPPVATLIGGLVFGFSIANVGVHMSVAGLTLSAVTDYLCTLAIVWLLGRFASLIAPAFGGARDPWGGLQLIAYASTASWVIGVANLYPSLGIPVGILAVIWSLYLLWLGLRVLLGIPEQRRLTAFAAILVALLALEVGKGALVARAGELGGPLSASYTPLR